jgi:hypothetical protein
MTITINALVFFRLTFEKNCANLSKGQSQLFVARCLAEPQVNILASTYRGIL